MRSRALAFFLPVFIAACAGKVARNVAECEPAALENCPQDTLPDSGECPLPPIAGVQGFFSVGCKVTVQCSYGAEACVCEQTSGGSPWTCNF